MARRKAKLPTGYLTTPDKMTKMVYDNVPKWQKAWQQPRPYASNVGLCPRLPTLAHLTPEHWVEKGPTLPFYADIGNAFEDRFNFNIFRRAGVFIQTGWKMPNVMFDNLFDVGGKIDSMLWLNDKKEDLVLLEVKTTGHVEKMTKINLTAQELDAFANGNEIILSPMDESAQKRIKNTAAKNPQANHLAQAEMYSAITGVDTTFVLLISRGIVDNWAYDQENNISHMFFPVDISRENLARRIANTIYACRCNEAGFVAQKPPDRFIKRSHCKGLFCPYEDECWGAEQFGWKGTVFSHVPVTLSHEWKKEAYTQALQYVDKRPERYALTIQLMHEYQEEQSRLKAAKKMSLQHRAAAEEKWAKVFSEALSQ